MCVAAIAWDAHPDLLLVAIGNRDEFHDRPAAPLARWADGSGIIAGRDLRAGGTWLGVAEAGRFALLTNFRDPDSYRPDRLSRGAIVPALLCGEPLRGVGEMNPFNAVVADQEGARFMTNYPQYEARPLAPGVTGLSNGPLGTPWPKTAQLCGALADWLGEAEGGGRQGLAPLFDALRAETPAPCHPAPRDAPQPDFAPVFIRNPVYGTRCSTVVTIARDGAGMIVERAFDPEGAEAGEVRIGFDWTR